MSTDESTGQACALSLAIPPVNAHGPYCPRRPNLNEILSNTAEAPWTLTAFMAYLSNNHCLETLEFVMDANRYQRHYARMMAQVDADGTPPTNEREYLKQLWRRLIEAYIQTSASREVNLPADVRQPLLRVSAEVTPPPPETLDHAVAKIYELMEESVLVPFLNSMCSHTVHPGSPASSSYYRTNLSEESISRAHEERAALHARHQSSHTRGSPSPPHPHPSSSGTAHRHRSSAPPPSSISRHHDRLGVRHAHATSSPAGVSDVAVLSTSDLNLSTSGGGGGWNAPGMTDDSGSAGSPTAESPTTPPAGSGGSSVGSPKRDSGMWKRLGRLSGMKMGPAMKIGRKRSEGGLREEDDRR